MEGVVVGHERIGGGDGFCENAIIEVETMEGTQRFTSHVASDPPTKKGKKCKVLQNPNTSEFIEVSIVGVLFPIILPVLIGYLLLTLALNTSGN